MMFLQNLKKQVNSNNFCKNNVPLNNSSQVDKGKI